jgi:uncharacterized RmlC-like cupin family protein
MDATDWRDGVRVVRGRMLHEAMATKGGRATAVDFASGGERGVWIGTVRLDPLGSTGKHHHGRHEVLLYVVRGEAQIRWGESLEYAANVGPGDFIYFRPFVPHQEHNRDSQQAVEYVVIRSDNERIAVKLAGAISENPQTVY